MTALFFRSLILYLFLILAMRLMGKRQVGELQVTDFVSTLLLSEIAAIPISDPDIPLLYAVVPIVIILFIEIGTAFTTNHCGFLKKILEGRPSVLIARGRIDQKELDRTRISIEELMSQLRQKSIPSVDRVEYAILEQNGQLSVIEKTDSQPVTCADLKLETKEAGIDHAVILDGQVSEANLKAACKDARWLNKKLEEKNLVVREVFLFTVDDAGKIKIIIKEEK